VTAGGEQRPGDDERRRAAAEIATRLSRRGVRLTGREGGEELVMLLDAVERFEDAVARGGGDLMMDQPVRDDGDAPVRPDNAKFVLPKRGPTESVEDFAIRISEATTQARKVKRPG
jgi:hypothetical protein